MPSGAPAELGLWDTVSIIVGIVVGVSIFRVPGIVFSNASNPWIGLGYWALGGGLSLVGALCYAELATTYPRSGGDYVYLSRAFGSCVGFLFGWGQLAAICTGSIGAMAFVFADYTVALGQWGEAQAVQFAIVAVLVLSVMNLFGVRFGKRVQNILTLAKVLGLAGILLAGFSWNAGGSFAVENPPSGPGIGLAMIFVLYAYGGWNDAAFAAADVRDQKRNMPRALLFGTLGITVIYLLVNLAYLRVLGFEGLRKSQVPATAVLEQALGDSGGRVMSLLVMVSALGAMNGLIFTGSRIFATLGADHRLFASLGRWHPRLKSPIWSLAVQAAVCVLLMVSVGTSTGQGLLDETLARVGLSEISWSKFGGKFDTLVAATAPVFWVFFLATGCSLFVLRLKDPEIERPFRAPFHPLCPTIFCMTCAFMLYSSIDYARLLSLVGIVPFALGLPLYFLSNWLSAAQRNDATAT